MEQSSSRPPIHDVVLFVKVVPAVIKVDQDLSLPANTFEVRDAIINQSPFVTMPRAKSAVSSRDMDDYSTAHTKDVHYLLIPSLMRVKVCLFVCLFFLVFFVPCLIVVCL